MLPSHSGKRMSTSRQSLPDAACGHAPYCAFQCCANSSGMCKIPDIPQVRSEKIHTLARSAEGKMHSVILRHIHSNCKGLLVEALWGEPEASVKNHTAFQTVILQNQEIPFGASHFLSTTQSYNTDPTCPVMIRSLHGAYWEQMELTAQTLQTSASPGETDNMQQRLRKERIPVNLWSGQELSGCRDPAARQRGLRFRAVDIQSVACVQPHGIAITSTCSNARACGLAKQQRQRRWPATTASKVLLMVLDNHSTLGTGESGKTRICPFAGSSARACRH